MSPFLIVAVACVVMVGTHLWTLRHWNNKMGAHRVQLEGQRDVQYKQAKQFQKELRTTQLATARVSDECARVLEDCKQLHEIAQDMVREVRGHNG